MADESPGSRNPADSEHLAGAFSQILKKWLGSDVDDMLPAQVIAYDRETNRATVKPLIRILKTDNTLIDREQISSIPVLNIGGGNAVLSFNIIPGDLGWIKANDRDISLFLQNGSQSPPNTLRKHKFSDALFIPDKFRNWTLDPEDTANAVLQTLDGTVKISLFDDKIKMTTPLLEVVSPLTTFTGDITTTGDITATGTITGETDVIADTVSGKSHDHDQGVDSAGNTQQTTDAPNP